MEKKQYIDIQFVKDLMEKLKMDNEQLAEKIRVTAQTVKRLLDGADQSRMRADIIINIASALGIATHLIIHKDYT